MVQYCLKDDLVFLILLVFLSRERQREEKQAYFTSAATKTPSGFLCGVLLDFSADQTKSQLWIAWSLNYHTLFASAQKNLNQLTQTHIQHHSPSSCFTHPNWYLCWNFKLHVGLANQDVWWTWDWQSYLKYNLGETMNIHYRQHDFRWLTTTSWQKTENQSCIVYSYFTLRVWHCHEVTARPLTLFPALCNTKLK